MKKLLLAVLFIPTLFFAQDKFENKIYLDSLWNESTENNYKYYRIVADYDASTELYLIKDYYKSGVLQMEGHSKTKNNGSKEGEFTFYYENGQKKTVNNYLKSRLTGKESQWHENGQKKLEGEYADSKNGFSNQFRMDQYWNVDGNHLIINGTGLYENKGDNFFDKGWYKNGIKDGEWTGQYNKDKTYTETYKKGELVSGVSKDNNGTAYHYTELESRPLPLRGINDFYKHIGKNFHTAKEYESLSGKIFTTFIVDKDGQIVEPKTIKSLNETLDAEAIRVISSYERWIPAKQRGQYVRVLYSIPITLMGRK
ncbi:energy transducer TonB [Flavobacterium sp. 7A]|uniref:energy transducer TonB n=1 Tax=Flavobacterium sp. 7A TaxID=2940571 RepID=UPI002226EA3C|nr:energy transducer TonB [Flavobacterium sp. 7A]MCW2119095.1 hypothetical protein [Flavobacterium sp. 7A]